MEDEHMELPPGFRFHPTDEELITHYLSHKVLDTTFTAVAIGEADLNKVEPWDLPRMAKMGEKEWYFFCVRDRKYPTGMRTNRATESGYWKATGKDKEIHKAKTLTGMKKTLVFYTGRAPRGEKSNWVMHEYRLDGIYSKSNLPKTAQNEWVLCRVFEKGWAGKNPNEVPGFMSLHELQSPLLPPLMESSSSHDHHNIESETKVNIGLDLANSNPSHVTCFSSQGIAAATPTNTTTTLTAASTEGGRAMMMSPLMEENMADFQFLDSVFVEDQPFMKIIKVESSQEIEMNNDTMSNYEMLQSCDGPIDLDFLWGY